jgi:hypothetical protein
MSRGVRSIAFLDLSISSIVNKATLRLLDLFPPSDEKFGGHVRVAWKRKLSWSVALALFHPRTQPPVRTVVQSVSVVLSTRVRNLQIGLRVIILKPLYVTISGKVTVDWNE